MASEQATERQASSKQRDLLRKYGVVEEAAENPRLTVAQASAWISEIMDRKPRDHQHHEPPGGWPAPPVSTPPPTSAPAPAPAPQPTVLVPAPPASLPEVSGIDRDVVEVTKANLVKRRGLENISDAELKFVLMRTRAFGLDPLQDTVAIWKDTQGSLVVSPNIHGLLGMAEASGLFEGLSGRTEYAWLDKDGKTVAGPDPPYGAALLSATVKVRRKGWPEPVAATAYFHECAKNLDRQYSPWVVQPRHMLEVRALAFALRYAFPRQLGGIYTKEETEDFRPAGEPPRAGRPRPNVVDIPSEPTPPTTSGTTPGGSAGDGGAPAPPPVVPARVSPAEWPWEKLCDEIDKLMAMPQGHPKQAVRYEIYKRYQREVDVVTHREADPADHHARTVQLLRELEER